MDYKCFGITNGEYKRPVCATVGSRVWHGQAGTERARRFEIQQQARDQYFVEPCGKQGFAEVRQSPIRWVSIPPSSNNSGLVQVVLLAAREHDMVVEYACIRGSEPKVSIVYCILYLPQSNFPSLSRRCGASWFFSPFLYPEPKHHPRVFPHYLYNTTLHTAHAGDGDGKPWEYIVHSFDGRSVKPQHIHVQPSPTDHSLSATGRPIPGLSSSPAASPSSLSLLCWRWGHAGFGLGLPYLRAG